MTPSMILSPAANLFYSAATFGNVAGAAASVGQMPEPEAGPYREGLGVVKPGAVDRWEEVPTTPAELRRIAGLIATSDHATAHLFKAPAEILDEARRIIQSAVAAMSGRSETIRDEVKTIVQQHSTSEAVAILLDRFSQRSLEAEAAIEVAQYKQAILQNLAAPDRSEILAGLIPAMSSTDPADQKAADAILIASWFGGAMVEAVQKSWPDPKNESLQAQALRESLQLLLREIGVAVRPHKEIRAEFDEETVTIYQAYSDDIGLAALKRQTLDVPGFKKTRVTWI